MGYAVLDSFGAILRKHQTDHFNVFGQFYNGFIVVCRVIIFLSIVNGLFGLGGELVCDVKGQMSCEAMCANRFVPINHDKLWQAELAMSLACMSLYAVVCAVFAKNATQRHDKEILKEETIILDKKLNVRERYLVFQEQNLKFNKKTLKNDFHTSVYNSETGIRVWKSKITTIAYGLMLIIRFCFEVWFCYLEYQLNLHQSQNFSFRESFQLKERWLCPINLNQKSLLERIPEQNRSIFWTDEVRMILKNLKMYQI